MFLSIKVTSWQIISRSHSRLSSTLILNSYEAILKRLNATDNAQALRKCNIPCSVQLVARKNHSQPCEGGCLTRKPIARLAIVFQHTAARRRLLKLTSTLAKRRGFNTQPRGGGCRCPGYPEDSSNRVSTHSRVEAAAPLPQTRQSKRRSFNTQPREGGCIRHNILRFHKVCFNTQPPEGGCGDQFLPILIARLFQHTATRRWLPSMRLVFSIPCRFQHTATRRWLPHTPAEQPKSVQVSTHSHPKVAALIAAGYNNCLPVSTHSHPKVAAY